jgi:hypothetical protein
MAIDCAPRESSTRMIVAVMALQDPLGMKLEYVNVARWDVIYITP